MGNMIKVFKIAQSGYDLSCLVKTAREVGDVVETIVLNDESAEEWGTWWPGPVTITIDIVEMDEAEFDALEPLESFGE